jgi:putative FmdB family regulatory protein
MPLYEYQCDVCVHRFEVIQQYKDAPIDVCPKCGGTVKKLFSSPAIQFKGSGFYITDYARKGNESATTRSGEAKSDSTTESKSDSKSESKSDSKSETKSESKSESKPSKSDS